MANKYWISSVAANFNDNSRWSTTSGGTNNTTAPGSNDTAIFNSGGLGNCTVSANATVSSLDITTGYTGDFSFSSYDFNVGDCYLNVGSGGTINLGSSTITCSGNFSWEDAQGTINYNTNTIVLTGYDKIFNAPYNGTPSRRLNAVTIEAGAKITTSVFHVQNGRLTVRGDFNIVETTSWYQMGGGFTQEGDGTVYMEEGAFYLQTGTVFVDDPSKLDCNNIFMLNSILPSGTWTARNLISFHSVSGTRTYTFQSGTYEFLCNVRFRTTSTNVEFTMDGATNNTNFIFHGNVVLDEAEGSILWSQGTGNVTFAGASNQTIEMPHGEVENIVVDKPSGKIEFVGDNDYHLGADITCGTFELPDTYTGAFDLENHNISANNVILSNDTVVFYEGKYITVTNGTFDSSNLDTIGGSSLFRLLMVGNTTLYTNPDHTYANSTGILIIPKGSVCDQSLNPSSDSWFHGMEIDGKLISRNIAMRSTNGYVKIGPSGIISKGESYSRIIFGAPTPGAWTTNKGGKVNIDLINLVRSNIVNGGEFNCRVLVHPWTIGTFYSKWKGDIVFNENLEFEHSTDDYHTTLDLTECNSVTAKYVSFTIHGTHTVNNHNCRFEITEDIDSSLVGEAELIWNKGMRPITFSGPNNQTIDFSITSGQVEPISIRKESGSITFKGSNDYNLKGDATCGGFLLSSYTGTFNDQGYNVDVAGDLWIDNTDNILNSTGTWTITADGTLSSVSLSAGTRIHHLRIGEGVTSTLLSTTRCSKLSMLANSHTSGSTFVVYPTENYPFVQHETAQLDSNIYFYAFPDGTLQGRIDTNKDVLIVISNNSTMVMEDHWKTGWCRIYGASSVTRLDTNGYNLNCSALWLGATTGNNIRHGHIFFRDGEHNISGNLYVAKHETHTTWGYCDFEDATVTVGGDIDLERGTISTNNATLNFHGETIALESGDVLPNLVLYSPNKTITFNVPELECKSLVVRNGTLDVDGNDITCDGHLSVDQRGNIININGSTITASSAFFYGPEGSYLDLNPASWNLNITGDSSAYRVRVGNSTASNSITAVDSIDDGGNTNWTFTTSGNRYWIASSTSNWNNPNNWSTTSGGAGGAAVPTPNDPVYFNGNGLGNCNIDMHAKMKSFVVDETYNEGLVYDNGYWIEISGDLITPNAHVIWSSGGVWRQNADGNASVPNSSSRLYHHIIGEGTTITRTTAVRALRLTVEDNALLTGNWRTQLWVGPGDNRINISPTGNISGGALELYPANEESTILQSGFSIDAGFTFAYGVKGTLKFTGDLNCGVLHIFGGAAVVNINTIDMNGYNLSASSIRFGVGNEDYPEGYRGTIRCRNGIINTEHIIQQGASLGRTWGYFYCDDATINISGHVDLRRANIYFDNATWTLNGTGYQPIQIEDGELLPPITINKPSDTTELNTDIHCTSLNQVSGTLNPNAKTIDVDGNCSISGSMEASGLAGSTWNIGGNVSFKGTKSNRMTLNPDSSWVLNVEGKSDNNYLKVKNSDASDGEKMIAWNSIDQGGNKNWTFNTLDNYKNINVVEDSTGEAGIALTDNFKYIADEFEIIEDDFEEAGDEINQLPIPQFPNWKEGDNWEEIQEASMFRNFGFKWSPELKLFAEVQEERTEKWESGVVAPNGMIYAPPGKANSLLKINPFTNEVFELGDFTYYKDGEDPWMWRGGVLAPNGIIYGLPFNIEYVLKIDPSDDSISHFSFDVGQIGWSSGVLANNNYIYLIPSGEDATRVLKIDIENETVSLIGPTFEGSIKWYGGILAPNGMIYSFPGRYGSILKIDPSTDTVTTIGDFSTGSPIKWGGGVLALNGMIYGIPRVATTVLKIDPTNDTITEFGNISTQYTGGKLGPNGKIYCTASENVSTILEIDPMTDTVREFGNLPAVIGHHQWINGVLGPNGVIYCPARNGQHCLSIGVPIPNFPMNLVLSRYYNCW